VSITERLAAAIATLGTPGAWTTGRTGAVEELARQRDERQRA
jgi:hypothetical protein